MSSAWNHAPNRSMVLSVRAAHFSSRSFRKGCSYSTSFRPIYPRFLDSPTNAFLNPPCPPKSGTGIQRIRHHAEPSSCEFWCSSRLFQSRLNQQSFPLTYIPEPWAPIINCEREGLLEVTKSSQDNHGKPKHGRRNSKRRASDRLSNYEPSPSEYLIDTIQNMVFSSRDAHIRNWTFSGKMSQEPLMTPLTPKQRISFKRAHKGSLQEVIADYIQYIDPVLHKWKDVGMSSRPRASSELEYALRRMLRGGHVECLESKHYDITDVAAWAWVLKSNTTYEATLRIFLLNAGQEAWETTISRRVPDFIPLVLLRQNLDLKTFRLLLIYSLHIISGQPLPRLDYALQPVLNDSGLSDLDNHNGINAEPAMNPSMCAAFVVRLLSHARRLWPEAQLSIAQAFALYLRSSNFQGNGFITKKLNMCLRLLSLPSGPRPFVSVSVRQQAQFELLKTMADKHPVSPVTRRGYQGLAAVQLTHRKTSAERQSAELKAPSWPPWKEEKSGIDFQKGVEGMKSRAMRVMSQMREAGYPHSLWEKVTGILAGWDTDNSPTIQTRTLVRPPESLRGRGQRNNHRAIWEARIRSTRTVREAWACFLAYESQGFPPHSAIYAAMGEKLIFRSKISGRQLDQTSHALPGDGLEVFPEPASARDWIYTPTEPPTLSSFLRRMLSQGIRPSGRFLAFLLHHTPSFRVGLDCLNCSDLTNQQIRALFTVGEDVLENDVEYQKALDELPEYIVSAFIRFLCRFSVVIKQSLKLSDITTADAFPIITGDWTRASTHIPTLFSYTDSREKPKKSWYSKLLSHAIRLLRKRESQNPQGWIQLLSGLRSVRILGDPSRISRNTQLILAWHEVLEVLRWLEERKIEMGSDGFQILCQSFSNAVTAGVKDPDAMEKGLRLLAMAAQKNQVSSKFAPLSFEDIVNNGLVTLKNQFDHLVLSDPKTAPLFDTLRLSLENRTDSQVTIPALPHIPSPAALHAFVRSLGLAEDSGGLISLLRWMGRHSLTLKQASDEYLNGDMMMRRTIVAVRLFLEGYWGRRRHTESASYETYSTSMATQDDSEGPAFSDPILQEAYDIVMATEVWGPWPSDEEVWEYFSHGAQYTTD